MSKCSIKVVFDGEKLMKLVAKKKKVVEEIEEKDEKEKEDHELEDNEKARDEIIQIIESI